MGGTSVRFAVGQARVRCWRYCPGWSPASLWTKEIEVGADVGMGMGPRLASGRMGGHQGVGGGARDGEGRGNNVGRERVLACTCRHCYLPTYLP